MSCVNALTRLLREPRGDTAADPPSLVTLPGVQAGTIRYLESRWSGFPTPEMRQLLEVTCGVAATPLGDIDFTGCCYPEESLAIFRPSLTLAVDKRGRRWIAELARARGLPGPVWCIDTEQEVALYIDPRVEQFLARLYDYVHRGQSTHWLASLTTDAEEIWIRRHTCAALPEAFTHMKELRGWLARFAANTRVYDLRTPTVPRGLPYGLAQGPDHWVRCGRLPVFALCPELTTPCGTLHSVGE